IFAEGGALCSYGPNLRVSYRRLAYYADRVLKGAKPADLPIEQPTKFELIVNLKTAKALGLSVPESILARAAEIIECATGGRVARRSARHTRRGDFIRAALCGTAAMLSLPTGAKPKDVSGA